MTPLFGSGTDQPDSKSCPVCSIVLAAECIAGRKAADTRRTVAIVNRQFGISLNNNEILRALKSGGR